MKQKSPRPLVLEDRGECGYEQILSDSFCLLLPFRGLEEGLDGDLEEGL